MQRVNRFFVVLVLCLCWGAASGRVANAKENKVLTPALCDQIESLNKQSPSNVLVIGEVHGTTETPEAVECISQRLLRSGTRVVLGLELPSESLDAITVANGNAATLRANPQWDKFWDGKTSEAMFHLIAWAKRNGVEVSSMEMPSQASMGSSEARSTLIGERIAERAAELAARYPDKHWKLVVLVGRFHALKFAASDIPAKLSDQGLGKPLTGIVKLDSGNAWLYRDRQGGVQDMLAERCNVLNTPADAQHVDLCLKQATASLPAALRAAKAD